MNIWVSSLIKSGIRQFQLKCKPSVFQFQLHSVPDQRCACTQFSLLPLQTWHTLQTFGQYHSLRAYKVFVQGKIFKLGTCRVGRHLFTSNIGVNIPLKQVLFINLEFFSSESNLSDTQSIFVKTMRLCEEWKRQQTTVCVGADFITGQGIVCIFIYIQDKSSM